MFRCLTCLTNTVRVLKPIDVVCVLENPSCFSSVRWARKPKWLPVAKSKMFRVNKRPDVPHEENIEIQRLTNNYRTMMKSLRKYLEEDVKRAEEAATLSKGAAVEEEDFIKCQILNNEWNTEIAKIREERLAREREEEIKNIFERKILWEEKQRKKLEEMELLVRQEKERAKYYITPENIDEAIETALRSEVDYNFCIDSEGKIYHGHDKKSGAAEEANEVSAQG